MASFRRGETPLKAEELSNGRGLFLKQGFLKEGTPPPTTVQSLTPTTRA